MFRTELLWCFLGYFDLLLFGLLLQSFGQFKCPFAWTYLATLIETRYLGVWQYLLFLSNLNVQMSKIILRFKQDYTLSDFKGRRIFNFLKVPNDHWGLCETAKIKVTLKSWYYATRASVKMDYFWIILSLCLALVSLGISGVFILFFAFISFFCGCLCIIYGISVSNKMSSLSETLLLRTRQFFEPNKLKVSINDSEDVCYVSSRLSISGSTIIDVPLSEIMDYIFRDYIYSWHFKLTHSKAYPIQLQETVQYALTSMSRKIQDVDWMPFLTTR